MYVHKRHTPYMEPGHALAQRGQGLPPGIHRSPAIRSVACSPMREPAPLLLLLKIKRGILNPGALNPATGGGPGPCALLLKPNHFGAMLVTQPTVAEDVPNNMVQSFGC